MSNNFYWACVTEVPEIVYYGDGDKQYLNLKGKHIGKKSGAGHFCWNCKITLCKLGEHYIHSAYTGKKDWHDFCPTCGLDKKSYSLNENNIQSGVGYVYTFTWAEHNDKVKEICNLNLNNQIIIDEYGEKYTGEQFLTMLDLTCPYQKYSSVGTEFS